MGRRRTYRRKKKLNTLPILVLILALVIVVALGVKIFSPNYSISHLEDLKSYNILKTEGTISTTSSVDTKVYSNGGIKYTNKHENIIRLNNFSSTMSEDSDMVSTVQSLIEKLGNLEDIGTVKELAPKLNGYYWINVNIIAEEKKLIFSYNEEYNINLYYDIEEQKIYIKKKYYDEFSTKNNKVKLQGYKVDDEYKDLIEKLAMKAK